MSFFARRIFDRDGRVLPLTADLGGSQFGDAVFETMLVRRGKIDLWPLHAKRLLLGLQRLEIDFDLAQIERQVERQLSQLSETDCYRMRLQIARAQAADYAGYSCHVSSPVASIAVSFLDEPVGGRLDIMRCQTPIAQQPLLAGIKHAARIEQVLCRREQEKAAALWSDSIKEGLVCDTNDTVIEVVSANVFFLLDGQWITPDLTASGVKGVAREHLLTKIFPDLAIACNVANVRVADVNEAEEIFICNALRGVDVVERLWLGADEKVSFKLDGQARQIQQRWFNNS